MRQHIHRAQPGQSIVVVALFAILLFLAIGLTIDGGMVYVQRRLMQNTADAACLGAANQIALGKTGTEATQRAQDVISKNLGATPGTGDNAPGTLSYSAIADLYSPASGSGTGLTRGIEVSGADIRVALQSPATTFFMRIIGIGQYTVTARSHCSSVAGGGSTPFAVARWRGFKLDGDDVDDGPSTDKALPQQYRTNGNSTTDMIVKDILQPASSNVVSSWPGWGSSDYPGNPSTGTGLYSSPSTPASRTSPGMEVVIAGNGAITTSPRDPNFAGAVVLDYRQTTFPQPLFYNGLTATSALNVYKDLLPTYLLGVYPGPYVIPGQQIAYYSGVSAGLVEKPFDLRYNVGDYVTTLIFNGTIYAGKNSYKLSFPTAANSIAVRSRDSYNPSCTESGYDASKFDGIAANPGTRKPAARFTVRVQNDDSIANTTPAFWLPRMSAMLSDDPANWGNVEGSWNSGSWQDLHISGNGPVFSVDPSGRNLSFDIQPKDKFTCTTVTNGVTTTVDLPMRKNGAQTIYLEAKDENTGKRRALYAFLNMNADGNDFYLYFPGEKVYEPREPGQNDSSEIIIERISDGSKLATNASGVSIGTVSWFTPGNLSSAIATGSSYGGVTALINRRANTNYFDISVASNATTGREYYLRVPVSYNGYTHYLWHYVAVKPTVNNSQSVNTYLYALGYAEFKITSIGSNIITGVATSGLKSPETLTSGMQPRLQAWDTSTP